MTGLAQAVFRANIGGNNGAIKRKLFKITGQLSFSTIAKRVAAFKEQNPGKSVISLGIGDVSRPLVPAVVEALKKRATKWEI